MAPRGSAGAGPGAGAGAEAPDGTPAPTIFLPARPHYGPAPPAPLQEIISKYVTREFPPGCAVLSVPRRCVPRREAQAGGAEGLAFHRLHGLSALPALRLVFFQGAAYAGRRQRPGRLAVREHDFALFSSCGGEHRLTLVEVKSTSDSSEGGLVQSDAKAVKNNKRCAQHQLRDHVEMLAQELDVDQSIFGRHIFWPFLSPYTKDPHDRPVRRWEDDGDLHVFKDVFSSQESFCEWFQSHVLRNSNRMDRGTWDRLFQRFILLSCGSYVDEIDRGLMVLLSQDQLELLHSQTAGEGQALIIHGAAGTGKTLLVIRKLQQLHQRGQLHAGARALYICYWPGIRCDVEHKLAALGLADLVDTRRFYISLPGFLEQRPTRGYAHVFMDECEALCLAFEEAIVHRTFHSVFHAHRLGNAGLNHDAGALWLLVDINQASLFLPKHSPDVLKTADVVLNRVMRSTVSIYKTFHRFYQEPLHALPPALRTLPVCQHLRELSLGHDIHGPPVYWVDSLCRDTPLDTVVHVLVDLCSSKGIKPNDICVLPYLTNNYKAEKINEAIASHFVEGGFTPQAMSNVESFLQGRKANHFLMPWILRAKGLEFKVVVMVLDDDDFDFRDPEDRRKIYIMASRCTCLLIVVSPENIKNMIDTDQQMQTYLFSITL